MELDFYTALIEEYEDLERISKLERNELHAKMKKLLSKFIKNKKVLEVIISSDTFLTEYLFLERAINDKLLKKSLYEIFDIYENARKKDEKELVKLIANYKRDVSKAADNYAQIGQTMPLTMPKLTKAAVKHTFREIGDFLEGSFQVFSKFVLSCLYIAEGKDVSTINGKAFGNCVNEIINRESLIDIYKLEPWQVPLSQWRNIANHNAYESTYNAEEVTCKYGSTNKQTVTLTMRDMYYLKLRLQQCYNVHKVSHVILFIQHYSEVTKLNPEIYINPETMIYQAAEFAYSFGFKLKQPDTETPIKRIDFGNNKSELLDYQVINTGVIFDVEDRAKLLAERTSSWLATKVIVSVYNSQGEKITSVGR